MKATAPETRFNTLDLEMRLCNIRLRLTAAEALLDVGVMEDSRQAIADGQAQLSAAHQQLDTLAQDLPFDFTTWSGEPIEEWLATYLERDQARKGVAK